MTAETAPRRRSPLGVVLVCLFLVLYALLWIATWVLAGTAGNGAVAVLAPVVAVAVLLVAYFLYRGSRVAWWIVIAVVGASTLWRIGLVVGGEPSNLSNAVVGAVVLLYLLGRREFYRPARS